MTPEQHNSFSMPILAAPSIISRFPGLKKLHSRMCDLHTGAGRALFRSAT